MSKNSKQLPYSAGNLQNNVKSECSKDSAPLALKVSTTNNFRDRSTDSYASHISRNTITTVTPSDSRYLMRGSSQSSHHRRYESQDRIRPRILKGKRSRSRSPNYSGCEMSCTNPREFQGSSAFSTYKSNRRSRSRSPPRKKKQALTEQYVPYNSDLLSSSFQQVSHQVASAAVRPRNPHFSDLPLEWWERHDKCKEAKEKHTSRIDHICSSREDLVLQTTLWGEETVLESNMFPYDTPAGVEHYTLWSKHDMTHDEIVHFVDNWLLEHFPAVRRWQYDDNFGERSVLLFHVHVFIEMKPFSFTPRPGEEYFPPHVSQ